MITLFVLLRAMRTAACAFTFFRTDAAVVAVFDLQPIFQVFHGLFDVFCDVDVRCFDDCSCTRLGHAVDVVEVELWATIRSATFCDGLETLRKFCCSFWVSRCAVATAKYTRDATADCACGVDSGSCAATHCAAEHAGIAPTFDKFLGSVLAALRHSAGDLQTFLA